MSTIDDLINQANDQRNNGQGLAAVATYREAVRLAAAEQNWDQAAGAQHMLGVAYKVENDIAAAIPELQAALPLYQRADDPAGAARVARDIGIAYDYAHQFTEGEPWLKRSVEKLEPTTDLPELGISQAKLGLHYLQTGHLDQADIWINRGLATIRRGSHWFYESTALMHRASLHLAQQEPSPAAEDLSAALALIKDAGGEQNQQRRLAQIYGLFAQAHLQLHDLSQAKEYFAKTQTLLATMPTNVAAVLRADIDADQLKSSLASR